MAKEKNLSKVLEEIYIQLDELPSELEVYLSTDQVALVVLAVYVNYDSEKAIGQDFEDKLSIVATKERIAIIGFNHTSFAWANGDYIHYENLKDDITDILIVLDNAVSKWSSR